MTEHWLLFLPQLPATPSSLRVLMWRRMRTAGALGLQNGVWVLPATVEHEQFMRTLRAELAAEGGSVILFKSTLLDADIQPTIFERFNAERDEEYSEFCGCCRDMLAEIAKETRAQKFSFAELEEIEQDFQKLSEWLLKIRARDFFGASQSVVAGTELANCRAALDEFTRAVYAQAGLHPSNDTNEPT